MTAAFKQARVIGALKVGRCILAETDAHAHRAPLPQHILISRLRVKEIEKIVRHRHGNTVPDATGTDDMEMTVGYLLAVAGSGGEIDGWCRRWLPWLDDASILDKAHRLAERLASGKRGPVLLKADSVAGMIHLTMAERTRLNIRTIGACDIEGKDRKRAAKATKQASDCKRQAELRKAAGATPRSEALSAIKPWAALGISRSSYYKKHRWTNSSHIEEEHVPPLLKEVSDETVQTSQERLSTEATASESSPIIANSTNVNDNSSPELKEPASAAKRSRGLGNNSPSWITKAADLGCARGTCARKEAAL